MAPAFPHENEKNIINRLVQALSDELDIDIESAGSTTFKMEILEKGAEPDDCFYIQNAAHVIGLDDDLDLEKDPPPDLVVEVERTNSSLSKFPIYAAMNVPEIWRVAKKRVRIHLRSNETYQEEPHSRAFPFLSSEVLSEYLNRGQKEGSRLATRAFRSWVREHKQ